MPLYVVFPLFSLLFLTQSRYGAISFDYRVRPRDGSTGICTIEGTARFCVQHALLKQTLPSPRDAAIFDLVRQPKDRLLYGVHSRSGKIFAVILTKMGFNGESFPAKIATATLVPRNSKHCTTWQAQFTTTHKKKKKSKKQAPLPTYLQALRSILGMAGFYAKFLHNYSDEVEQFLRHAAWGQTFSVK